MICAASQVYQSLLSPGFNYSNKQCYVNAQLHFH